MSGEKGGAWRGAGGDRAVAKCTGAVQYMSENGG